MRLPYSGKRCIFVIVEKLALHVQPHSLTSKPKPRKKKRERNKNSHIIDFFLFILFKYYKKKKKALLSGFLSRHDIYAI